MKRPPMSEAELQMQVVALLNAYARPDICFFHVPNGEERHKGVAKRLKLMGVQKGVADLMFMIDGNCHAVELKTEIGTQSGAQAEWQERFERAGGVYHIAHGLDEAVGTLMGLNAFRPGFKFSNQFQNQTPMGRAVRSPPWRNSGKAGNNSKQTQRQGV